MYLLKQLGWHWDLKVREGDSPICKKLTALCREHHESVNTPGFDEMSALGEGGRDGLDLPRKVARASGTEVLLQLQLRGNPCQIAEGSHTFR